MWKTLLHYKTICISSLMKMFAETATVFLCWRNESQVLHNLISSKSSFQIRLGSTRGGGGSITTVGSTSSWLGVGIAMVKDFVLWGLRSQRSQSHFTANSSMFSTTAFCNKGWILSLSLMFINSGSLMDVWGRIKGKEGLIRMLVQLCLQMCSFGK